MASIYQFPAVSGDSAPITSLPANPASIFVSSVLPLVTDNAIRECDTVELDPELARIFVALGYAAPLLLYSVARQRTSRTKGSGVFKHDDLLEEIKRRGVRTSKEVIRRHWLTKGDGVFWNPRNNGKLGIVSYDKLCAKAVEMAIAAGKPELVSTNPPGTKFIHVPLAKTLKGWCGNVLAAWHYSRDGHTHNISRYTLNKLWGTTTKTLLAWEQAAGITVSSSCAVYTDGTIPKYAFPVVIRVDHGNGLKELTISPMARHSNIYNVPSMRQKQHKRVPGEAKRIARSKLEELASGDTPDSICGQPTVQADRVGFSFTKRRNFFANDGDLGNAFKRLNLHLRSDPDDLAPHFVQLGWDAKREKWIYEQNSDGVRKVYPHELIKGTEADRHLEKHGGWQVIVNEWRKLAA